MLHHILVVIDNRNKCDFECIRWGLMNFKQMEKTAKKNAKLSLGITAPLTMLSILFIVFNIDRNAIFSSELQLYEYLYFIPLWLAFVCSILAFILKNPNALEKLGKIPKPLIYLIILIPYTSIIRLDIFNFTEQTIDHYIIIATLLSTLIGFIFILYLLLSAIVSETRGLTMEEELDIFCRKQGLSEEEIREFKRDFKNVR